MHGLIHSHPLHIQISAHEPVEDVTQINSLLHLNCWTFSWWKGRRWLL